MAAFSRRFIISLILLILVAGLVECRRGLRAPVKLDPAIEEIRLQYAETHPDDPFLAVIAKQELRKGMNPTQVYLSWGRPVHRFKGDKQQKWIYEFSEDLMSQPKTIAHLFFKHEKLVKWKVNRGYVFFLDPETGSESGDDFGDLPGLGSSK